MGRTIHDTWGVAKRAQAEDWADPEIPKAIAEEMRRNWMRQRAIRKGERRVRRRDELPPHPVTADSVPVVVADDAPYVFHAATEEDVRAVLGLLPPGSLDGLREVRLCLHGEDSEGARVRDPFTGRLRFEVAPGIFRSRIAGTYTWDTAVIRIHPYLCAPETPRPLALAYKMEALRTLVHEAAHHFDHTFRKRRSRWATGEKEKHEAWAEQVEEEQARDLVGDYLVERYPAEVAELGRWIERHGGIPAPPAYFLRENRSPLYALARSVFQGDDPVTSQVVFADELHQDGFNEDAQRIVDAILAARPDHAGALAVSACILNCGQRDLARAEELARRAVGADPGCLDAWDVLVRAYATHRRWSDAAHACEEAITRTPDGDAPRAYFVRTLYEAHLRLEDWAAVESLAARMATWGERSKREGDAYRVLALAWSERWEPALQVASRLLVGRRHDDWQDWLAAAKYESAHRLGRSADAGAFTAADLRELERRYLTEAWAQRIREHVAPPPGSRPMKT